MQSSKQHKSQGQASAALDLPSSTTIFIGCGFLLAENHGPTTFSVVLPAADARQSKTSPSVVVLDGVLVQAAVANATEMGAPKLRGTDLLRQQMRWEGEYVAKTKGWPNLRPFGDPIDLGLGEIKTILWGYDAPEIFEIEGVRINRMLYVAAAVDDTVLTLASPLRPEDDARTIARVLFRSMRTLRRETSPVDVFAISAAGRDGKPTPEICARIGPN